MKFRLDSQHYLNDRLLEPGHIIGDETDVALPKGFKPSVNMTPLDGAAESLMKDTYPGVELPERDPTAAIPLRGTGDTAKAPPVIQKVDGQVVQPSGGPVKTLDDQPGSYVIGPDGEPTKELKKGMPDSGSPNHPVGQPVIGTTGAPAARVPAQPEDPNIAVKGPQAQAPAQPQPVKPTTSAPSKKD